MFGPILNGLAHVIDIILNMVQLLVIASIVVSWVGADPHNQIVTMVRGFTEPLYRPFRKLTKGLPGPFDWAPMIVLLIITFIQYGLVPYLRMMG